MPGAGHSRAVGVGAVEGDELHTRAVFMQKVVYALFGQTSVVHMQVACAILFYIEQQRLFGMAVVCGQGEHPVTADIIALICAYPVHRNVGRDGGFHLPSGALREYGAHFGVAVYFQAAVEAAAVAVAAQNEVVRVKMVHMRMSDEQIPYVGAVEAVLQRMKVCFGREIDGELSVYQHLGARSEFRLTERAHALAHGAVAEHCGNAFGGART